MPNLIVVEQLRAFLIAEGVGQSLTATPSPTVPSVWLMPRQGAAMPRQDKDSGAQVEKQTITLLDTNLMGPPNMEAWLEDAFIDVTVRSLNPPEGKLLHRVIRNLLAPIGKLQGRANWTMNELHILSSHIWRAEQALPPVDNGLTYDRVASYRIRCARSELV